MKKFLKKLLEFWKKLPLVMRFLLIMMIASFFGAIFGSENVKPNEDKRIREFYNARLEDSREVSYNEFQMMAYNGEVDTLWYNTGKERMVFVLYTEESKSLPNELRDVYTYEPEQYLITQYPDGETFRQQMLSYNINLVLVRNPMDNSAIMSLIASVGSTFLIICVYIYLIKSQTGAGITAKDVLQKGDVDLEDIIGLEEVMGELKLIINLMKNPEYGEKMGVRLPHGLLLSGPSGTGKTMIAKAISKAVDIPFISVNGSDFQEMYVGNGARRVRQVFKIARQNSPCIIFVDEFDALGERRDSRGSSSEDTRTINAILKEMDGFKTLSGVFIMAATNHPEKIDPAVKRPGRFDREVIIAPPRDWTVRKQLFEHYLKDKPLSEDVDIDSMAKATPGFTGADIATICNEAGIVALSQNLSYINTACIEEAIDKKVFKGSRSQKVMNEKDRRIVAYHEAGHAVVSLLMGRPISRISIISTTSGVGGAVFNEDTESQFKTKDDFESDVMVCYAGRCAEDIKFHSVTTGASNDIEQATQLVYDYVCKYGFYDDSPKLNNQTLVNISVSTTEAFSRHIFKVAQNFYDKTHKLVGENIGLIDKLAEHLLEVSLMPGDEVSRFLGLDK